MKTTGSHAFVSQLLICLLVTFSFGGSFGLVTVWMRHQNAKLANSNRVLEARIAEVRRRIAEVTTAVEGEQTSDVLRRQNANLRLGYAPAIDKQIFRMPDDPVMRLARRHGTEIRTESFLPTPTSRFALKN